MEDKRNGLTRWLNKVDATFCSTSVVESNDIDLALFRFRSRPAEYFRLSRTVSFNLLHFLIGINERK